MSRDKRAALVMQIMAEFMRHPARSSKAAEAALDIALKAAAEIAREHSWARDIDWWLRATKKEVSAVSANEAADAILALTSEGTKP